MPIKILISDGNVRDGKRAEELIKDFKAEHLIADEVQDRKVIVEFAAKVRDDSRNFIAWQCENAEKNKTENCIKRDILLFFSNQGA